jgi:hypothetical protein
MDNRTRPSKIYITTSIKNHGNYQEEYTSNEKIDHNQSQRWREEFVIVEFFRIIETLVHQTTFDDHPTNKLEFDQHYYVKMLQNPTMIEK